MAKQHWREKTANSPAAQRRVAATTRSIGRWRDQPLGLAAFLWGQSRLLRFPIVFAAFVVALTCTAVIVSWLSPLHRPQLTIISSEYNDPLLPRSVIATRDARALGQLSQLFDMTNTSSGGLKQDELRELIRNLPEIPVRPRLFVWQKTSHIVYVNAAGIAVPESNSGRLVPYLLPSDFSVGSNAAEASRSQGVPLVDLLDNFALCPTDHKILILDCQDFDQLWSHGILRNRFVESVQELLQDDKFENLSVIFSSSPGELTWNNTPAGHSAFGWFFMKAVSGAADLTGGDQDGRVTLREVFQYVETNVDDWVRNNRDDKQRPQLITRGNPEDVVLAVLSSRSAAQPSAFLELPSDTERAEVLASLRTHWQDYYTLSRQSPHPVHDAPHLWQRLEHALLSAEAHLRDFDTQAARDQIEAYRIVSGELANARKLSWQNVRHFSLPARQLFAQASAAGANAGGNNPPADNSSSPASPASSPPAAPASATDVTPVAATADKAPSAVVSADGSPSDTPADKNAPAGAADPSSTAKDNAPNEAAKPPPVLTPADVAGYLKAIEQNNASALDVGALLLTARYAGGELPVEAELLRTLAEHGPRGATPEESAALQKAAQQLAQNRLRAEQAAIPVGTDSPRVFGWIRGWVDEADRGLRQGEDQYFAQGYRAAPLGSDLTERTPGTETYDVATLAAERLARAHRAWEQSLAELPYLVRFSILPAWNSRSALPQPNGFQAYISQQTTILLESTSRLSRYFETDPGTLTPTARARQVSEIHDLATTIEATRTALHKRIAAEAESLRKLGSSEWLQSESQWRLIEALLSIPFSCSRTAPIEELVTLRLDLLQGLQKSVEQAPTETAVVRDHDELPRSEVDAWQRQHDQSIRTWALKYFAVKDGGQNAAASTQELPGYSEAVARAWYHTYSTATAARIAGGEPLPLLRADIASRLLDAGLVLAPFGIYDDTPTRARMHQELARYLVWLGTRHAEDFWAGPKNRARPYFLEAAGHYLQLAGQVDVEGAAAFDTLTARLTALAAFARQLRDHSGEGILDVKPPVLAFRGTDVEQIHVRLGTPPCPMQAIARIRCQADPRDLAVTALPTAQETSAVFPFEATRLSTGSSDTLLNAELFLRGHVCSRPVPVEIAVERGPTVVYQNVERHEAELNVRSAEATNEASHVLFVIDCSRSMADQNRIEHLRDTLMKFADVASQNGLNVGIRVFGDSVVWRKGDDKAEQAARKDSRLLLPIEPFTEKRFREAVAQIKPRGETPLFHALLEARQDFARVNHGTRTIVVISDGADNWARIGQAPGPLELQAAYQNSGIQVNAIGFQTDAEGYQHLEQIAGATAGQCVQAAQAEELLASVFGQIKLHKYSVTRLSDSAASQEVYTAPLRFRDDTLLVPPGLYDVRVTDLAESVRAERRKVRIRAGERHELLFGGGTLNYPSANLTQDVAHARDSTTRMTLRIMRADIVDNGLQVRLALLNELQPEWRPSAVEIRLRPRGIPWVYTVQNLPENVPGYHFPVWSFRVENWPSTAEFTEVEVSWSEGKTIDRETYTLEWESAARDSQLPEGFRITRRRVEPYPIDGELQNTAVITLVYPRDYPNTQDWSLSFREPVAFARQTYNVEDGVYTGRFTFQTGQVPSAILVHGPRSTQSRSKLSASVSLRLQKIN